MSASNPSAESGNVPGTSQANTLDRFVVRRAGDVVCENTSKGGRKDQPDPEGCDKMWAQLRPVAPVRVPTDLDRHRDVPPTWRSLPSSL